MHIPENYLSPSTCGVLGAVMVPIWLLSIRKVKETVPREKLPLLGVAAAFSFLAMMFNVPLPGGTTGHAVGGTLIAILLGPYAACLSVSVALLIQALFFGDGGILAFGANSFNIAFALPFTGYFVYHGVKNSSLRISSLPVSALMSASTSPPSALPLNSASSHCSSPMPPVRHYTARTLCPFPFRP